MTALGLFIFREVALEVVSFAVQAASEIFQIEIRTTHFDLKMKAISV
jgi:hypothetical protein